MHVDIQLDGDPIFTKLPIPWEDDSKLPYIFVDDAGRPQTYSGLKIYFENEDVIFEWTNDTNTKVGKQQNAGVVSKKLLDVPGYHSCGNLGAVLVL